MVEKLDIPTEIIIELTSKCNLDCSGCFNRSSFAVNGRKSYLESSFVKKIIDSACKINVPMIRFTGGESLLHPDLLELIKYAKSMGVHTRLNTNATLLTPTHLETFDKYLDSVLVSFNGYNDESDFLWTNSREAFPKKQNGLKLLSEIKTSLRIGTVLTLNNIEKLESIFQALRKYNVSHWEVYRLISNEKHDFFSAQIESLIFKLISFSIQSKMLVPIANAVPFCVYEKEVMNKMCNGAKSDDGHSRIVIDPRGFAKPSYYINENIGNPLDILECWNHPFMLKMRNLEYLPVECQNCEYKSTCKGGSRFKAKIANGDYKSMDPLMVQQ